MGPPLTASPLEADKDDVPDLTETLQTVGRRVLGRGAFGAVYRTVCTRNGEVAVKAITLPPDVDDPTIELEFVRKMKRELGIWRRLEPHPNIVPLLGKARGDDFASDYPCMVAMLMPHGTLSEYVSRCDTPLPLSSRIRLIQGSTAGLGYLHSKDIVHGDFHPGNILIDSDHNPRVTDFGFSQTLTRQDHLTYLFTHSARPGAKMWVAPELSRPDLFEDPKPKATLSSDIYSLGSIILFTLSGKLPWDKAEFDSQLEQLNNPPRPLWPIMPDVAWEFIERCWSPRVPKNRPSAQEVLSFTTDRLGQLLQPNPESDINVVLFGALGCGKSSIVNLLAGEPIAPVSKHMGPCTKRPRCYRTSIGKKRFRVWDTTGFRLPRGGAISHLSPYEQAHTVLRDLPGGVHLILLCASKDEITPSLRNLYWLINDFFFGGQAPLAFVVTHVDTADKKWWEQRERNIAKTTGIPVQSMPHVCTTTAPTLCDQSRKRLRRFLENYATTGNPIPLNLDLSSHEDPSRAIATNCGLPDSDAATLVAKFSKPRNPLNVVLFGRAGDGKSSVVNLVAGRPVAQVSSDIDACTSDSSSYSIDTSTKQFLVWDTMGFNSVRNGHDTTRQAVLNAVQLIRKLTAGSGVDLLVFVKNCGKLTPSELNCYRFFEEFLCEGQVPVAVVITHLEDHEVMEGWWETNGNALLAVLNGNVIGHACITSLAAHDSGDAKFSKTLSESRLTVQGLFESCFSCPKGEGISVQLCTKEGRGVDRTPEEMTVENLVSHCGLAKELAREVIRLYNPSG